MKEFEPRLKSAKTRFKLSAGLNLETFDTILSGTNQYLRRGLNLNRRSNSLNSATGYLIQKKLLKTCTAKTGEKKSTKYITNKVR